MILTGSSKITREWIVLGRELEREIPYKALVKFRYGLALDGISYVAQEIAIDTDPTTSEWQKQKLHKSNAGFTALWLVAGIGISLIPGAGLAILAGIVASALLNVL